jgi:hypothetical protein
MKTLFTLLSACLLFQFANAQYCGSSGPFICTPPVVGTGQGLTASQDIPCITRGQASTTIVEILGFDSINPGLVMPVQNFAIDSIENLPPGLCWATNSLTDSFGQDQTGCIRISGTTNAAPGQYLLRFKIRAIFGPIPLTFPGDVMGFKVYLRVVEPSFLFCPQVDTSSNDPYLAFSDSFDNVAEITGKVFYDQNQNNIFDSSDIGAKNQLINVGSNYVALTNSAGNYTAYVSTGSYVIQPAVESFVSAFPISPSQLSVNVPTIGVTYANNDIAVTLPGNVCIGDLNVVPTMPPPRPGFTNNVVVKFQNQLSASPASQTVRLFYSPHQNYVNAMPAPTVVDTAAHLLEWQLTGINVGSTWQSIVTLQTPPPPSVPIGTLLSYSANIVNSSCSSFDTLQTRQEVEVVGSYDPNDKAVSPVGVGSSNAVLPNTPFTYTVRFQNTGTYLAEKVVIIDTISPYLNLATLQVTAASHNYEVSIETSRAVKFIFNNIMLPDSFSNEPESHGFIQYSIKPNSNTANGSVITNRADIYFDFNPPILTNTVSNTIDESVSIGEDLHKEDGLFVVYPNPSTDGLLNVDADKKLLGEKLQVTDLSGKVLFETTLQQEHVSIKLPAVAKGVYLLKASNGVRKLLIQ